MLSWILIGLSYAFLGWRALSADKWFDHAERLNAMNKDLLDACKEAYLVLRTLHEEKGDRYRGTKTQIMIILEEAITKAEKNNHE